MSGLPDVAGGDITTAEQLEAQNAIKIQRLIEAGCPEAILNAIAIQVRVESIVSVFPKPIRDELELRYESTLGKELDDFYGEVSKPRLITPGP